MDTAHITLLITFCLAAFAAIIGVVSLQKGERSKFTFLLMAGAFVSECVFLYIRGEQRGRCPLSDWGEILVFIAWSLSIFYMLIGSAYRVSLLGFFSAPLVALLSGIAMLPGVLDSDVVRVATDSIDAWGELHAALSVLSYGALSLAAVASVMFLFLNKKLKDRQLTGGLFKNLPPVFELITLIKRLVFVGLLILTAGILSSLKMEGMMTHLSHLWAAVGVWVAYVLFLMWSQVKGMTPGTFAKICCVLFVASLIPFGLL